MSVRWTCRLAPLAEADLESIWLYTFRTWSLEQADLYHANLIAAFDDLCTGRRSGRPVDIRDGYIKFAVGSHVVFYRLTDTNLDVMRILHVKMDAERHL